MTIIGIDPGTAIVGYAVIKKSQKKDLELVTYGCIKTSKNLDSPSRLKLIYEELTKLIKKHRPDCLASEELFFFKNLKTAIKVSQAQGVIKLAAASLNLSFLEFTPLQVKQAVTGYGLAQKQQVQKMVRAILKLKEIPRPDDAADAIAIAICAAYWQKS